MSEEVRMVQLGRVVRPRLISRREHKAVITGIINATEVVIMHSDKSYEVVSLKDLFLDEEILNLDNIEKSFFEMPKNIKKTDFELFKERKISLIKQKIIKNKFN